MGSPRFLAHVQSHVPFQQRSPSTVGVLEPRPSLTPPAALKDFYQALILSGVAYDYEYHRFPGWPKGREYFLTKYWSGFMTVRRSIIQCRKGGKERTTELRKGKWRCLLETWSADVKSGFGGGYSLWETVYRDASSWKPTEFSVSAFWAPTNKEKP